MPTDTKQAFNADGTTTMRPLTDFEKKVQDTTRRMSQRLQLSDALSLDPTITSFTVEGEFLMALTDGGFALKDRELWCDCAKHNTLTAKFSEMPNLFYVNNDVVEKIGATRLGEICAAWA